MLFNSFQFIIFLALVLPLYYALNHRWQNRMLLVASYIFYGAWDWRFLILLSASTVVDFGVTNLLNRATHPAKRRWLVAGSVTVNLLFLCFFKYMGFFVESLNELLSKAGLGEISWAARFALPVGISFYTFQTISYTIDVYRRRQVPTRDFVAFALYVSYFPHMVAGPIQRAHDLLPQLLGKRSVTPDAFANGLQLMLIGYLKKIAIADAVAPYVNDIFNHPASASSLKLMCGLYLFAIQIYCDFSGYSDIARGVSRLMGIELTINFRQPYLAYDISDFWRRWHISLSSWLRDYLYISLGGNRGGRWKTACNLMITMLLGGLWHGAAWTFVIWGGLHGLYLGAQKWMVAARRGSNSEARHNRPAGWIGTTARILLTFHLVCFAWLFFRANSLGDAGIYLAGLCRGTLQCDLKLLTVVGFYLVLMLLVDVPCWATDSELPLPARTPWYVRGATQAAALTLISFVGATHAATFIYFQF